jgi:hypothetical protein
VDFHPSQQESYPKMMTFEDIVREVRALTVEERKQLITFIVDSLTVPEEPKTTRSILELQGLGADLWKNEDAQAYVNRLRGEWNNRP